MVNKPLENGWVWVDSNDRVAQVCEEITSQGVVAVDTEFRRRDTFFPQIALMQLATTGHCWLLDPLVISDVAPIRQLLLSPNVVKVLHSASEDLEVFAHWLGVTPERWVDTQKAAAMLNLGFGLSYRALIEQFLGIELAKDETNSDWLARPLSASQCDYAAADVTFLAACWPMMEQMAAQRGVLDWIHLESAAQTIGGKGPLAKFKSAWKLPPTQLATLQALIDWREGHARQKDKPRSWILADKALFELAQRMPESSHQLAGIDGMPSSMIRRHGKALLDVISKAREQAQRTPPAALPKPASSSARALAKQLAAPLQTLADQLVMNVEILMPGRELELLAREALGESIEVPSSWAGWRTEVVVGPMRETAARLAGGLC